MHVPKFGVGNDAVLDGPYPSRSLKYVSPVVKKSICCCIGLDEHALRDTFRVESDTQWDTYGAADTSTLVEKLVTRPKVHCARWDSRIRRGWRGIVQGAQADVTML